MELVEKLIETRVARNGTKSSRFISLDFFIACHLLFVVCCCCCLLLLFVVAVCVDGLCHATTQTLHHWRHQGHLVVRRPTDKASGQGKQTRQLIKWKPAWREAERTSRENWKNRKNWENFPLPFLKFKRNEKAFYWKMLLVIIHNYYFTIINSHTWIRITIGRQKERVAVWKGYLMTHWIGIGTGRNGQMAREPYKYILTYIQTQSLIVCTCYITWVICNSVILVG